MRKIYSVFLVVFGFTFLILSCRVNQRENVEEENSVIQEREHQGQRQTLDDTIQDDSVVKEAYERAEYDKVVQYLETGINGNITLSNGKTPLLFDLYEKHEAGDTATAGLYEYFLKNQKVCFETDIDHLFKGQTIGSYIAHFGSLETLKKLAEHNININSKNERAGYTALFHVASKIEDSPGNIGMVLGPVSGEEKLERLYALLEAGADVTLRTEFGHTIFHYFAWWPADEDFEDVLTMFIEKGADVTLKYGSGHSAIYSAIFPFALEVNYKRSIQFFQKHGLEVTEDDYYVLYKFYPKMIGDNSIEEFKEREKAWENNTELQEKLKELEAFLSESLSEEYAEHRNAIHFPYPITSD